MAANVYFTCYHIDERRRHLVRDIEICHDSTFELTALCGVTDDRTRKVTVGSDERSHVEDCADCAKMRYQVIDNTARLLMTAIRGSDYTEAQKQLVIVALSALEG